MSRARKILMAGGTFSVALGIGFVMQNGDALAARFSNDAPVTTAASLTPQPQQEIVAVVEAPVPAGPVLETPVVDELTTALAIPEPSIAPTMPPAPIQLAAAEVEPAVTDAAPVLAPELSEVIAQPACDPVLTATAGPAAMVHLVLTAPCDLNAQFTMHHQGMMFSEVTDAEGKASFDVPALADVAVFIASFDGGAGAVATVAVPEVANFDRAVLQWQGDAGLSIHAREFGAGYDDPGHVWAQAARTPDAAETGVGGFLVHLGNDATNNPLIAEVYSYPTGTSAHDGDVILSVEADITAQNCGRDVSAQSIQITPEAETTALDLSLTMPECDAVGDLLMLKAMLTDLRVASR